MFTKKATQKEVDNLTGLLIENAVVNLKFVNKVSKKFDEIEKRLSALEPKKKKAGRPKKN